MVPGAMGWGLTVSPPGSSPGFPSPPPPRALPLTLQPGEGGSRPLGLAVSNSEPTPGLWGRAVPNLQQVSWAGKARTAALAMAAIRQEIRRSQAIRGSGHSTSLSSLHSLQVLSCRGWGAVGLWESKDQRETQDALVMISAARVLGAGWGKAGQGSEAGQKWGQVNSSPRTPRTQAPTAVPQNPMGNTAQTPGPVP